MDTPEKSNIGGIPLSVFEDSPVFNYINNLSPIQAVESVHIAQTFHSLNFASVSSIFTSPHVNFQKESRFLIRHSSSDLPKAQFSSDNGNESNLCAGVPNVVKLSGCTVVADENCNRMHSLNGATIDHPGDCSSLLGNLHQLVQYDCGSPNHNTTPCYSIRTDLKLGMSCTSLELVRSVQEGLEERKSLFTTEIELHEEDQMEQYKVEVPGSDWENLISDDGDSLLIFDSFNESEACRGPDQKLGDNNGNSPTSLSTKLAADIIDDSQKKHADVPLGPCIQNSTHDLPVSEEVGVQNEIDHTPEVFSGTCQNQAVMSRTCRTVCNATSDCISLGCQVHSQQQRGMRRRCLTFEVAGFSKKNLQDDSNPHPSISLPSNCKFASNDRQSVPLKSGIGPSPCALRGIGLHLNTLATASKDKMVNQDTLASGRLLISKPCSLGPFFPTMAGEKPLNKSSGSEKDMGSTSIEVQELHVMHDDTSQVPAVGNAIELSLCSPKRKRRRSENGGENEACRRCTCKRSKCLKLYCECFAAGVYCVEPCSCQECFNKPVHEDIVLATRKQIESRNPLAFAPKVIRTSEPVQDMEEKADKTPASARHKKGCNCKKSSCLKKYCECYQGGVGCSISCRCEGCKNAYGRNDGIVPVRYVEIEHEGGETDACEKVEDNADGGQQNADVQKDGEYLSESILHITPLQICRPSVKLPIFSSGKPPPHSTLRSGYSLKLNTSQALRKPEVLHSQPVFEKHLRNVAADDTPEILRGNASPSNSVMTSSPNGKRVSPPHNGIGLSPHRKGSRKLILKSIPSFPSLSTEVPDEYPMNCSQTSFNAPPLS